MFSLNTYLMTGFRNAVGRLADYQIILNSAGWHEKGVLTGDDLAELAALIAAQYEQSEELPEGFEPPAEG